MTKVRSVLKRIRQEARKQGVPWTVVREGANHTVYDLDGVTIPVPRHSDIGEGLTREIYKQCEARFGEGWWRK